MAKNRYIGEYPVIGIRPTIDGRRGVLKVRESLEEQTMNMAKSAAKLLTENPLFVIINSYTTGLAPSAVGYAADVVFGEKFGGHTEVGELGLPVKSSGLMLPRTATKVPALMDRFISSKTATPGVSSTPG